MKMLLDQEKQIGDLLLPAGTMIHGIYKLDHEWVQITLPGAVGLESLPVEAHPDRWPGLQNAVRQGRYALEDAMPWVAHPCYNPQ